MAKKKYNPREDRSYIIGADDNMENDNTDLENELNNDVSSEENATDTDVVNQNDMEKEASQNELKLSPDEVPSIKDMDIGNTIVLNVELKLKSKDENTGEYVFDVTDIYSPEEASNYGNENENNTNTPSQQNLANMLGGMAG